MGLETCNYYVLSETYNYTVVLSLPHIGVNDIKYMGLPARALRRDAGPAGLIGIRMDPGDWDW